MQSLEIDEMINRVARHKGVVGVMVFSNEGVAIKSTFDETQSTLYAAHMRSLIKASVNVGNAVSKGNELDLLRLITTKYEFLISPDKNHVFVSIHEQKKEPASEKQTQATVEAANTT